MTKEQIQLLIQRGHITPETGRRMVQHYAEGGVVAMPLKAPEPPQPQQPTFEQTLTEMSPIAGAGYGLVKNLIFDQRPPGEFEPGGGGITESISPIDLITPTMVAAPVRAVAGGIGKGAIQGAKAIQQGILARGNAGAIEVSAKNTWSGVDPKIHTLNPFKIAPSGPAERMGSVTDLALSKKDPIEWAKSVDLSQPIEVTMWKDGTMTVTDGHHRQLAAQILNQPIKTRIRYTNTRAQNVQPALSSAQGPASAEEFEQLRSGVMQEIQAAKKNPEGLSSFIHELEQQKPAQAETLKSASGISREQFNEMAARGKLNPATGVALPEEKLTQTPVGMGLVNNYPIEDIAHFYSKRMGGHPSAYDEFMADVARESQNKKLLSSFGKQKPAQSAPKPTEQNISYRDQYTAPGASRGVPLHDFTGAYPESVYGKGAVREFGTGNDVMDKEAISLIQKARNNPDAEVTIYRAVPKGVKDINEGDWVTPIKQYAINHGENRLGNYEIITKKVKAGELFNDGNSILEFGWDPAKKFAFGGIVGGNMFTKEQADMMLQRGLITPQTYQRITGAQGYAEGGEVMPAPLPTPAEEIPSTPISVNVGAPVIPEQFATMPAPMPAPTPIPQMTPAGAAGVPLPGQYGPPSPMSQTPPATERAIVPGTAPAPAGFQMPGEASMMKAAGLEAQAAQQVGKAAEKAYEGLQTQIKTEHDTYKEIQSNIQARLKTLDGELMGGQINPNRVWSEASTGAKVGAVLGMLFSGIGAGVTGKENLAVSNINKMIDRDIEAQKANIQNKQNLFSKYLTQLGDARQAEAASRLHLLQAAEVQVKQAQAKAATPQAQAAFEKTRAQLEQQKAQYTIELTKMMGNASLYGMGGSEGGIPFGRESFYQASDPELQKRIVPVADKQRSYLARSDQEAAELRKMESAYSKARKMLGDLKQYSSIGARLSPEQRAKADAIVAKLPPLLNELNGYARFTEMEQELLEKTFSAPGILNAMFAPNTKTNALLKDLDTQMQNKRAIMLQGYKPVTTFEPGAK
jgi:hypothetical protein